MKGMPVPDEGPIPLGRDTLRQCSLCRKEFVVTEREKMGLAFLRDHHMVGPGDEGLLDDAPLFGERGLCLGCIRGFVRANLRQILSLPADMLDTGDGRAIPNPAEMDTRGNISELSELLGTPGLRPDTLKGPSERMLEARLPHIRERLELLFQEFPGIEESEFFRMELDNLFGTGYGFFGTNTEIPDIQEDPEISSFRARKLQSRLDPDGTI